MSEREAFEHIEGGSGRSQSSEVVDPKVLVGIVPDSEPPPCGKSIGQLGVEPSELGIDRRL